MSLKTSWFIKSRRAQNVDDYETWNEGGVTPTLNVMDNTGDTRATVLILFEPKSLFEENWGQSEVKNALRANASKSSHLIIDGTRVGDVRVIEDGIVPTVISRYGTGGGNVPMVFPIQDGREIEKSQNGLGVGDEGAPAYTVDTHATQAVAFQLNGDRDNPGVSVSEDLAFTLPANPMSDRGQAVAIQLSGDQGNESVSLSEEKVYTLQANAQSKSQAVAIQGNMIGRADTAGPQGKGYTEEGDPMFTLTKTDVHAISFDTQFGSNANTFENQSPTLKHSQQPPSISHPIVRRLTPTECERLQGFPDGWTEGQSDSHRYKQMGNAVAVPCVAQIIESLVKHAQIASKTELTSTTERV